MNRLLLILALAVLIAAVSAKPGGKKAGKGGEKGPKMGGKGGEKGPKIGGKGGKGEMGGKGPKMGGNGGKDGMDKGSDEFGSDEFGSDEDMSKEIDFKAINRTEFFGNMTAGAKNVSDQYTVLMTGFINGTANATSAKDILAVLKQLGNGSMPLGKKIHRVVKAVSKLEKYLEYKSMDGLCIDLGLALKDMMNDTSIEGMKPSAIWAKYNISNVIIADMACMQSKLGDFEDSITSISENSTAAEVVGSVASGMYSLFHASYDAHVAGHIISEFAEKLAVEEKSDEQQVALRNVMTLKRLLALM